MGRTHQALQRAELEYQNRMLTSRSGPDLNIRYVRQKHADPPRQATGAQHLSQYAFLKSNLFSRYPMEKLSSIAFTSTYLGDGTTTTAVNFAAAMASDSQRSVLVVDGNFRHPCLHDLFHVNHAEGLSDFLVGEHPSDPPYIMIGKNMHLLTAGTKGPSAVGRFESPEFDHFLEVAVRRFDHVVVDCPPVGFFSETRVIAGKVGGVILVVHSGKTRQRAAIRAKNDLVEARAELLGAVLNRRKFHIPYWVYKRL